ncbi:MAG: histidinol dehydrogenase [Eggerthellaceae bacterium]|nr:histidinol dehydrogenase [Eggerthellaceae bacterium]
MAQAEHDPQATCYLITFSEKFADEVEAAIAKSVPESPRKDITAASLDSRGLTVICRDIDQAIEAVNVIAPEHLELDIKNPFDYLGQVDNAGAIFLGQWTPEAVGDYVAGPNHTLPTGGTARFDSPLSVEQFEKRSSIIQYTPKALKNDAKAVTTLASHEGLWAHAQSVERRLEFLDSQKDDGQA